MNNILPLDAYALRDAGLCSPDEDFSWPLGDEDYFALLDFIMKTYVDLLKESGGAGRALITSDFPFMAFLFNYFHIQIVGERCRRRDIRVVSSILTDKYIDPDWKSIAREPLKILESDKNNFLYKLKHSVLDNSHLGWKKYFCGLFKADALCLSDTHLIIDEYIEQKQYFLCHSTYSLFFSGWSGEKNEIDDSLRKLIEGFFSTVNAYLQEHFGFELPEKPLYECWLERLGILNSLFLFVRKQKLPELYLFRGSNPLAKIIANAFIAEGKKALYFDHGNSTGGLMEKWTMFNGADSCSELVSYTRRTAESLKFLYKQSGISKIRTPEFSSVNTSYFKDLHLSLKKKPFPEKIKKIMLLGYPMDEYRYPEMPGLYCLFQLDLELRLIELLKRGGYDVVYKIHPDRINEAEYFFRNLDIEISEKPFEEVFDNADALLIKYTASSVFIYSLCTNKPIFLFDLDKGVWNPAHFGLVEKRCNMVESWIGEGNRIYFNEKQLLNKLSRKPEYPDFSYIHEYMFPEKTGE